MKRFMTAAICSLALIGLSVGQASAGTFGLGLFRCFKCSKKCYTLHVKPYNAFTPFCSGCITATGGCCPPFGHHHCPPPPPPCHPAPCDHGYPPAPHCGPGGCCSINGICGPSAVAQAAPAQPAPKPTTGPVPVPSLVPLQPSPLPLGPSARNPYYGWNPGYGYGYGYNIRPVGTMPQMGYYQPQYGYPAMPQMPVPSYWNMSR